MFLIDAVKSYRMGYFKCYNYLMNNFNEQKVKKIQELLGKFIIFSAEEWYRCVIPLVQQSPNPIFHEFLRLMLSELLTRGLIQRTIGWDYVVIRVALLYWCCSPVPSFAVKPECYTLRDDCTTCIYCQCNSNCMFSDECSKKGKYKCFIEAGIHLCSAHGEYLLGDNGSFNRNLKLKDGRTVFYCGRTDYVDLNGIDTGYNLLYYGKDVSKSERKHSLSTYYGLDQEYDIFPPIHKEGELYESPKRHFIGPAQPPMFHQDEIKLRDYLVQKRVTWCPETNWGHSS